jgi:hypothetical protein
VLPLLKPVVVTLAIFTFLASWNDFMWPLIVLSDQDWQTAPVALAGLSREHVQDNELMMAGSVVTVLPVLALFLVLQRYYIQGLPAREREGVSARGARAARRAACVAAVLCALAPAGASRAAELLDDFSNPGLWRAQGSDDVTAVARVEQSKRGRSLCLDFDLAGTAGYASLRRELPLSHSAGQGFRLTLRGDAPANDFQFKLVDAGGANVWWHRRPDFVPPGKPQTIEIGADAIDFAWGPSADKSLTRTARSS